MMRITYRPGGSQGARAVRLPTTSSRLFVCAECKYAQLFAVQPRAVCTLPGAPLEGVALFAGQPACDRLLPRVSADTVLSRCSPGLGQAPRLSADAASGSTEI
jgi:hypothetical protein